MKPSWKWCRRILALGLAIALGIDSRDEPPAPPDPALTWSPRKVASEDNGYSAVRFADEEWPNLPEQEDVLGTGKEFQVGVAEALLAENAPALQKLEKCLAAGDFVVGGPTAGSSELEAWRKIGLLVACRSRLLHETGKEAEAVGEALKLMQFGQRLRRSGGMLQVHGLGRDLFETGVEMLFWLVSRQQLDSSRLQSLQESLSPYSRGDSSLEEAFLAGREYCLRTIDDLQAGRRGYWGWGGRDINLGFWGSLLPGHAIFKPNQTKRGLDLVTRFLVLVAEAGCRALLKDTALRFHLSALRSVLALRSYRGAHGKLPRELKDLVPEFLNEIPVDPCDDQPLRYSAEKGIIYSIGSDYRDAGGSEKADPTEAAADQLEPTFQVGPGTGVQG